MPSEVRIPIRMVDKPLKVSKEMVDQLKGVVSKNMLSRMRREAVDCPVKGTISFIECFSCERFIRRVKGEVHCRSGG